MTSNRRAASRRSTAVNASNACRRTLSGSTNWALLLNGGGGRRIQLQENGKHAGQCGQIARKQRVGIGRQTRLQIAAQIVDDAIERLIRHRLVFVTAAAEDYDVVSPGELTEKAADQGALADARCAVNGYDPRASVDDRLTRVGQFAKLAKPADERRVLNRERRLDPIVCVARQCSKHRGSGQPLSPDPAVAAPCRVRSDLPVLLLTLLMAGADRTLLSEEERPAPRLRMGRSRSGPHRRSRQRRTSRRLRSASRRMPPLVTCTRAFRHEGIVRRCVLPPARRSNRSRARRRGLRASRGRSRA